MADRQCGREDGEAEIGPSANEIAARIIYVYMYMCVYKCVYIYNTHTHTADRQPYIYMQRQDLCRTA